MFLGPGDHETIVERRECKVRHHIAVPVDAGDGGLVGASAGGQRENGDAGSQGVPVEPDKGGTSSDEIA